MLLLTTQEMEVQPLLLRSERLARARLGHGPSIPWPRTAWFEGLYT